MPYFHEVAIPCPICSTDHILQSYSEGENSEQFGFEDAPIEVIAGLDVRQPIMCNKCKSIFKVNLNLSASIELLEKGRFADAIHD